MTVRSRKPFGTTDVGNKDFAMAAKKIPRIAFLKPPNQLQLRFRFHAIEFNTKTAQAGKLERGN
jgi:hypothetical protein